MPPHELPQTRFSYQSLDLEGVLEDLMESVVFLDADGRICLCNKAFSRLTGYDAKELIGRNFYDLFQLALPWDRTREIMMSKQRRGAHLLGASEEYESRIVRKDGAVRWLEVRASPLRNRNGEIVGSIEATVDITERKEAEAQLLDWTTKMQAVGLLAGGLAHDFNNMVAVIRGYAEKLARTLPDNEIARNAIEAIESTAEYGESLSRQLLTFTRKQPTSPKLLDMNSLLETTRGMLEGVVGARIELHMELAAAVPPIVVVEAELQQIVVNLVLNAAEAIEQEGTITVATFGCTLEEELKTDTGRIAPGNYAVLRITDTGCGIPLPAQSRLFEPFFSTKPQNTGLGLATVVGIVRRMEGGICLTSIPGHPTEFTIFIPAAQVWSST
ncbi:MAG: PAS domain S-box protein [Bdellovibrionales bacterium]|nr:PAS domain S-box protein [Bdellovibrionales bacterium]